MLRRPALFVYAVLSNLVPALALAQSVGINPSAAPSDIRSPSSTNPAAAASDIGNPSSNNPAAAASDLRGSRAGIPSASSANRSSTNLPSGAARGTGVDAQRIPKQHAARPKFDGYGLHWLDRAAYRAAPMSQRMIRYGAQKKKNAPQATVTATAMYASTSPPCNLRL